MTMRTLLVAAAIAGGASLLSAGEPDAPAPPAKAKFSPRDVEVRLRDGSAIRGQIADLEHLAFQTNFGTLQIPVTHLFSLTRGKRRAPANAADVAAAAKKLTSDDAAQRAAAQQLLEDAGQPALDALFEMRQKAGGEPRTRIDALIKRILSSSAGKENTFDTVKAAKLEGKGTIQTEGFTLKSKLGDLKLKFEDVAGIQWLSAGTAVTVELQAPTALREWSDTGIDTTQGETVAVAASGEVLFFGSNIGPTGSTNWGGRPFRPGTLVGRLGANGQPFAIGSGKRWPAESSDRLYVKMFATDDVLNRGDLDQCSGNFTVKIASGARADEVEKAGGE